jgi:hypothetical protein
MHACKRSFRIAGLPRSSLAPLLCFARSYKVPHSNTNILRNHIKTIFFRLASCVLEQEVSNSLSFQALSFTIMKQESSGVAGTELKS